MQVHGEALRYHRTVRMRFPLDEPAHFTFHSTLALGFPSATRATD